jgi:O-antigen/teichoic acid export membrane protein
VVSGCGDRLVMAGCRIDAQDVSMRIWPRREPEGPDETSTGVSNVRAHDATEENLARKVVRAGSAATGISFVTQLLAFGSFIVLAHFAPPSTFGEYAAASVLLGVTALFTEAGMHAAVIQRRDDELQAAASTALMANAVGGLALALLAAAAAPIIGLFFHSRTIGLAAAALAGIIPLNAVSIVPGALIRRRVSIRLMFVEPIRVAAYAAAAIPLLLSGFGVWALVIATYAAACARTGAIWKYSSWRPTFRLVSWEMWRSLSRYGRPVLVSLFLREVGFTGTTAFVGRAFGTAVLGEFRYASRLVLASTSTVTLSSAYVLLPAFSRIAHEESRFAAAILRAIRLLTVIVFPLSMLFIPLGRPIAATVLGEEWKGAGPIMMALAGVGLTLAFSSVCAEAFKASGRTEFLPRLHAITATAPVAFMFALLPLGSVGMGLAMSLGLTLEALYAVRATAGIVKSDASTFLRQAQAPLVASLVMIACVFPIDRRLIHAEDAHGIAGLALLLCDFAAATVIYAITLGLLSRRAVIELKHAVGYLAGQRRDASPAESTEA